MQYALPRTVLQVTTKATLVVGTPSDQLLSWERAGVPQSFKEEQLSRIDLKLTDLVLAHKSILSFDGFEIGARPEPDPEHVYTVSIPSGWGKKRELKVALGADGIIGSSSDHITDRRAELTVGTLAALAKVAIKAAAAAMVIPNGQPQLSNDEKEFQAAVEAVLKSREEYNKLFTDNLAGLMPDVLKERASFWKRKEAEALAIFTGEKKTTVYDLNFDVRIKAIPADTQSTDIPLFQWDKEVGIDASGAPEVTMADFPQALKAPAAGPRPTRRTVLRIAYSPVRADQMFSQLPDSPSSDADRSYRHRIPARVQAKVVDNDEAKKTWIGQLTQLGKVVSLPARLQGGSATLTPVFYTDSGALKELNVNAEPGKTGLEDAATAASTSFDSIRAARDPLAKAKYEADRLEALKKAYDARRYLETNNVPVQ